MIEAQIQYAKIEAVSRQMGENLQRISRSPLVSRDQSFATALLTGELELAVQHQYEPEHLFAVKESVHRLFDYFSFDVAEGDILLVADPYNGGTKGQTLTMAAPVFHQGEMILFPAVRVQMTDLAGEYPGGYNPDAFEVWQESMRITPVKLYKQGLLQRDVLRFLLANSRVPSLYESELQAMYACCRSAQEQIETILSQHGSQLVDSIGEMIEYSRRRVAAHISQLPAEIMQAEAVFFSGGQKLTISASIKAKAETIMIDFNGTDNQLSTPLNATLSTTKAFAAWPLLAPLAEEVAINEGTLQLFSVQAPKGSMVNPDFPAATGLSALLTGHFISEVVAKALKAGKADPTLYSEIHGTGPQAILFPPLGKHRETEPLFLVPGYPETKNNWGPAGLFGNRKLVSAEELELYYGFKIVKREWDGNNGMVVRLVNHGMDYCVNLIIPEEQDNKYGTVSIYSGGTPVVFSKSSAGNPLKHGDEIEFHYPREERVT